MILCQFQLITFVIDKCFGLIDIFERHLEGNTRAGGEWEPHVSFVGFFFGVSIGVLMVA
jgi:hypothetical protein